MNSKQYRFLVAILAIFAALCLIAGLCACTPQIPLTNYSNK
jgi:hypothetical protein